MLPGNLEIEWLGRVPYLPTLERQEKEVERRADPSHTFPDTLLLLEHEPVYTLGRTPGSLSLPTDETLLGAAVHRINRGGEGTYHGPGQLIGYPILDLRRRKPDLHAYLRVLESWLIEFLDGYGVHGERNAAYTGVWVKNKKIASIGVGVRRWVCFHGFALIVEDQLTPFEAITPCGIQGVQMTSLSAECGQNVTVQEAARRFAEQFPERLERLLPPNASR